MQSISKEPPMARRRKSKARNGIPATSQYLGVSVDCYGNRRKRYKATIHSKGKTVQLGRYFYEIEAATAYINALDKYPL
jgi:hypothetical protein